MGSTGNAQIHRSAAQIFHEKSWKTPSSKAGVKPIADIVMSYQDAIVRTAQYALKTTQILPILSYSVHMWTEGLGLACCPTVNTILLEHLT